MSLHGTQASFDPLSAGVDSNDREPAPTFNSSQGPAPLQAGGAADPSPSQYDSFMTAHSNMSYMTAASAAASTMAPGPVAAAAAANAPPPPSGSAAAAAAGPPSSSSSSLFRRLPDRPPLSAVPDVSSHYTNEDPYNPFASPGSPPPPSADSNPFAAPPPPLSYPQVPQHPAATAAAAALGPLSFGDDTGGGGGGAYTQANTAFAMPSDLYDTPESFTAHSAAAAAPAAAAAARPAALPPLHDFTRDFSRVLPVSEDPVSPADVTGVSPAGWYGTNAAAAAASGGGASRGPGTSAASAVPAGGAGAGVLSSYAAAALLTNTVSVHSPRKALAPSRIPGLSESYMVYQVTSRSATSPETTVDRRFRDVVALAELLALLYPGCFVPPRPSRNAVEGRRMQPAFIDERRLGIEKFLRRLVVHPVLGPSEATQVWLHAVTPDLRTCPEWARLLPTTPPGLARSTARLLAQVVGRERTVPSPLELTRPAGERGDMYRLMHERAAQMRGVLGRVQPSPMEERLREDAAALQERSELLVTLSRRADHLVTRGSKSAAVVGDLGTALGALAERDEKAAEGGAGGPSPLAALRVGVDVCAKVSKLYGVATDASAKHLTPLHDWLAATPGAVAALAARERCLLTVATLEADEKEARGKLAEAVGKCTAAAAPGTTASVATAAAKKAEAARLQVAQLEAATAAARDEYDRVGARNAAELAAYKAHMSRELADAVREFALVQLAAAQKAHELWQEAAAALVTMAASAAAPPAGGAVGGSSGVSIGVGVGSGVGYGTYGTAAVGGF